MSGKIFPKRRWNMILEKYKEHISKQETSEEVEKLYAKWCSCYRKQYKVSLKRIKNGGSFAFDLNDLQVWELLLGSGRNGGEVVPVFSLPPLQPGVPHCPQRRPLPWLLSSSLTSSVFLLLCISSFFCTIG